jgi:hypothetical protein
MAPSRPAVHPDQWGLVTIVAIAIGIGLWAVVKSLTG